MLKFFDENIKTKLYNKFMITRPKVISKTLYKVIDKS